MPASSDKILASTQRHAWADAKENANNYYNDDVLQRAGVLWIMALLVVYGNNAVFVVDDISAMRLTVGTYMVLRFSQICFYALYSIASHHHRTQNRAYFVLISVGLCILIPLFFESISLRVKIAVAVIGILYEVGNGTTDLVTVSHTLSLSNSLISSHNLSEYDGIT